MAKRIQEEKSVKPEKSTADAPSGETQSLAQMFAEVWSQVPEEDWADVPRDLSTNLDKYLYPGDAD